MRHPAYDYIIERLAIAISPLIEEIEALEAELGKTRPMPTDVKITKKQMLKSLKQAAKLSSTDEVRAVIKRITEKNKFDKVNSSQYPKLLAALDDLIDSKRKR